MFEYLFGAIRDFLIDLWDALTWSSWRKWHYRWQHRDDSLEEAKEEMFRRWNCVLDEFKDEPEGRELIDAKNSMEEIRKSFGDQ